MEFLRQIEEDLQSLGAESKRKHPEVKESTDKAISTLKSIREIYVSDMMRNKGLNKRKAFPQSSDITAPYILALNYADASPKLISMALNGLHLLLNYEIIPQYDVKNILRVLTIQANSGKSEGQLKLLQIILQLANFLSQDPMNSQYMTEPVICSFLGISFQLCDSRNNISVSNTGFATGRQIISIVLNNVQTLHEKNENSCKESSDSTAQAPAIANTAAINDFTSAATTISSQLLVKDIALFLKGQPAEWIKGCYLSLPLSLDLVQELLTERKHLFTTVPAFRSLVKDYIFPAMKPLLKNIQEDFQFLIARKDVANAASITSRVVRVARCFLLDYVSPNWLLLEEFELLITYLVHALQPETGNAVAPLTCQNADKLLSPSISSNRSVPSDQFSGYSLHSSLPSSALIAISRLNAPVQEIAANWGKALTTSLQTQQNAAATTNSSSVGGNILNNSITHLVVDSNDKPGSIPAHSAGCAIEALLSLFLSPVPLEMLKDKSGSKLISSAITASVISTSYLLKIGLSIKQGNELFEAQTKISPFSSLFRNLLNGSSDNDCNATMKYFHEALSAATVETPELLVLCFQLLQVVVRFMSKLAFATYKHRGEWISSRTQFFLDENIFDSFTFLSTGEQITNCHTDLTIAIENIFDSLKGACEIIVETVQDKNLIHRSLGILIESAMISSICGHSSHRDATISSLCKSSLPVWLNHDHHDVDYTQNIKESSGISTVVASLNSPHTITNGHIQSFTRCVQLISVTADLITDWDSISNSFEQIHTCYCNAAVPRSSGVDNDSDLDITKILDCLENFKKFTIFLSSETLVKLMTSLVVMSLNTLSIGNGNNIGSASTTRVSYSLEAVVEITKYNGYRASCIWQMVTSHLRMIGGMRLPWARLYAVNSTFDMINSSFDSTQELKSLFSKFRDFSDASFSTCDDSCYRNNKNCLSNIDIISDKFFNGFLSKPIDLCFEAYSLHKEIFRQRTMSGQREPSLSQEDLLSSLKSLVSIKYGDVRHHVIRSLYLMLQSKGHLLRSGWLVLIELIALVPASVIADSNDSNIAIEESNSLTKVVDQEVESIDNNRAVEEHEVDKVDTIFPKSCLNTAFLCLKFMIDDFIDLMDVETILSMMTTICQFGEQIANINISLTSVEMLWKVFDLILIRCKYASSFNAQPDIISLQQDQMTSVLSSILEQLLRLSKDERPEIRNCSINSLYSLCNHNANVISPSQWKFIFESIIFQMFDYTHKRSLSSLHEDMETPEIKKGVQLLVHHSRDSVFKQWSETRSLLLRGMCSVMQTCMKLILNQEWFVSIWKNCLNICKSAIESIVSDKEVSHTGVSVLFNMLKFSNFRIIETENNCIKSSKSRPSSFMKYNDSILNSNTYKEVLWKYAWLAVKDASTFSSPSSDLALQMSQSLQTLYLENKESFISGLNLYNFLEAIILLARPRLEQHHNNISQEVTSTLFLKKIPIMQQQQLNKAILLLLKDVHHTLTDPSSLLMLCSSLAELIFATQVIEIESKLSDKFERIYLGPINNQLRQEVFMIFDEIALNNAISSQYHQSIADIVFGRFINDECSTLITSRKYMNNSGTLNLVTVNPSFIKSHVAQIWNHKMIISILDNDISLELHKPQQSINENSTLNDDYSWEGFLTTNLEIDLLLKVLGENKSSEFYNQSTWSKLVICVTCILSPWLSKETKIEKSFLSEGGDSKTTTSQSLDDKFALLLDTLFDVTLQQKLVSPDLFSSLIAGISSSSKLIVNCVSSTSFNYTVVQQSSSNSKYIKFPFEKQLSILSMIRKKFVHVINSTQRLLSIRGKALEAYLQITSEMTQNLLKSATPRPDDDFVYETQMFLENLIACDIDFTLIPIGDMTFGTEDCQKSFQEWLNTILPERENIVNSINITMNAGIKFKSHLLLILPSVVRLVSASQWPGLQKTANEIMQLIDLGGLLLSVRDLLLTNEQLNEENMKLQIQVKSLLRKK